MASDWAAGDLALCVKIGPWVQMHTDGGKTEGSGPRPGTISVVTKVAPNRTRTRMNLWLQDWPQRLGEGFAAYRFRKVTPPAADEFDRETIALMRSAPLEVVHG